MIENYKKYFKQLEKERLENGNNPPPVKKVKKPIPTILPKKTTQGTQND